MSQKKYYICIDFDLVNNGEMEVIYFECLHFLLTLKSKNYDVLF